MAIDKRSRPHPLTFTIRDHPSPSSTRRCFSLYDKSKSTSATRAPLPSILRRRTKYSRPSPLRMITSRVNNNNSLNNINNNINNRSPSRSISGSSSSSFSCPSSAGKRIKIILHQDDYSYHHRTNNDDETLPPSFTPPPSADTLMVRPKAVTPPPRISTNKVTFFHKVQVLRIPSRKQYPQEMKKNLWASLSEITENAKRNSIEYTAEGWDWRTVLEEEDMYRHPRTGEYVHPIHVQREYQKRMMAAAKQQRRQEEMANHGEQKVCSSSCPQEIEAAN